MGDFTQELDQWAIDTSKEANRKLQKLRITKDTKVYINGEMGTAKDLCKSDKVSCVMNIHTMECAVVYVTRTTDGISKAG